MADNNVPSIQAAVMSVQGNVTIPDPTIGTNTLAVSTKLNMAFTQGGGAGQINAMCGLQIVLPASGNVTFNLNTGGITGTSTVTINNNTQTLLMTPDAVTFTTTALHEFLAIIPPTAIGSSSAHFSPGPSNGFAGWLGGSSPTLNVRGGVNGGGIHQLCSDSIGWGVSSTTCNLVLTNDDSGKPLTMQIFMAGA